MIGYPSDSWASC